MGKLSSTFRGTGGLHFLFAWRYFKAKKSTNAINIIAWISIVAMIMGTAALILVLSVFNGFEGLVKSLYSSFYPDLRISSSSGKIITLTNEQLRKLKGFAGIKNFSLIAEEKALLKNGDYQSIIFLKGVDENYRYVTGVEDHIVKGEYNLGTVDAPLMILGSGVEDAVAVQTDRNLLALNIYLPKKTSSDLIDPLQNISEDTINTRGTFKIQQDFDNKYAITNLEFVKKMLALSADQYSAAEIVLKDPANADDIKPELQKIFGSNYKVQTRYEQNQGLYSVMRAEKWVIYAVLVLLMIVFSFTIVSSLTILVIEKEKDIMVLHALGGNRNFIQKIFLSEGLLLAIIGGILGMLLALLLAWLQVSFKLIPLQGGSFLIDYFPVTLKPGDFLLVSATVLIIAMLASWVPARKAALNEFSLRSE
ncbi:MAG TPA: FtsX-like permease family protein [Chitinophagaceae bacterium]|jgi:lipoprotein-releasing system permease protein|nr:FtsX-like permease family protein [Chitinophagaceae bacterium]